MEVIAQNPTTPKNPIRTERNRGRKIIRALEAETSTKKEANQVVARKRKEIKTERNREINQKEGKIGPKTEGTNQRAAEVERKRRKIEGVDRKTKTEEISQGIEIGRRNTKIKNARDRGIERRTSSEKKTRQKKGTSRGIAKKVKRERRRIRKGTAKRKRKSTKMKAKNK